MSAHPMLQPVDWSLTPESLKGGIDEDRRNIYEVVWNSAIACTLKPPVLVHHRFVYGDGHYRVAIASVSPAQEKVGYWHFRDDFPSFPFPTQREIPDSYTLTVTDAVECPA